MHYKNGRPARPGDKVINPPKWTDGHRSQCQRKQRHLQCAARHSHAERSVCDAQGMPPRRLTLWPLRFPIQQWPLPEGRPDERNIEMKYFTALTPAQLRLGFSRRGFARSPRRGDGSSPLS